MENADEIVLKSALGKCHVKEKYAKVFYRIFPQEHMTWDNIKMLRDRKTIYIRNRQEMSKKVIHNGPPSYWKFLTDGIFYNNTQAQIYQTVTEGILDKVVNKGMNAIIMAFGQTGAGKSITIGGLTYDMDDFGITPRIIRDFFMIIGKLPRNMKMVLQMSYVEFSKVKAYDLMKRYPNHLSLLRAAKKVKVHTEVEALKHLFKGEGRKEFVRHTSGYKSHLNSSVLTFHITTKNMDLNYPRKIKSKLHIIDLAGIDEAGNLSSVNKHILEVGSANSIKSDLEHFLIYLCENIPEKIRTQRRLNKITQYLGNTLSNESIIRFIGHIKTSPGDLLVTISLIRFGQLLNGLVPKKKMMVSEENEEVQLQYLKTQVEKLKTERILDSIVANVDLSINVDQERLAHIQRTLNEFLQNKTNDINTLSCTEIKIALQYLKERCNNCELQKADMYQAAYDKAVNELKRKKTDSSIALKSFSSTKVRRVSSIKAQSESEETEVKAPVVLPQKPAPTKTRRSASVDLSETKRAGKKSKNEKKEVLQKEPSDIITLPDSLPEYKDAWTAFKLAPQSNYTKMLEEYKYYQSNAQVCFSAYMNEIKNMEKYKDIVDIRKKELMEAEMQAKFHKKEDVDEDGEIVLSESEKVCMQNLKFAEGDFIDQQERVLSIQSEFKIYINMRRDVRQRIRDNFNEFCKLNYNIIVPLIHPEDEDEVDEPITVPEYVEEDASSETSSLEEDSKAVLLQSLHHLMQKEIRLKQHYKTKHKKWYNYPSKIKHPDVFLNV